MDSDQSKLSELKSGRGQWRVIVGASFAGSVAAIALYIYFMAVAQLGWIQSLYVAGILLVGLAAIPRYLSNVVQDMADKMFAPDEICVTKAAYEIELPPLLLDAINYFSCPPLKPPRSLV